MPTAQIPWMKKCYILGWGVGLVLSGGLRAWEIYLPWDFWSSPLGAGDFCRKFPIVDSSP
jgi:hypothetical protein